MRFAVLLLALAICGGASARQLRQSTVPLGSVVYTASQEWEAIVQLRGPGGACADFGVTPALAFEAVTKLYATLDVAPQGIQVDVCRNPEPGVVFIEIRIIAFFPNSAIYDAQQTVKAINSGAFAKALAAKGIIAYVPKSAQFVALNEVTSK